MTDDTRADHALQPGWHHRAAGDAARLRDLYRRLDELARGQGELLEADRTEELLGLLNERSGVIDQIKQIAATLHPVMDGWDRLGATVPEPTRGTLGNALEEIRSLTATILDRDREHTEVLIEHKNSIAGELTSVVKGRAAIGAYSGQANKRPQTPRFQDRQG
ncbi:MAG: hypothetical protein ACI89L_002030 [Phycisphaerales bacterium]|jgi:hypothetical protein